jgi:hypothetical protein
MRQYLIEQRFDLSDARYYIGAIRKSCTFIIVEATMISVKYLMIRIKAIKQLKEFMAPPLLRHLLPVIQSIYYKLPLTVDPAKRCTIIYYQTLLTRSFVPSEC